MDEHHGAGEGAGLVERVAEVEVVVVLEAHAAEDDHVRLGLQRDARQQLVVGLAGLGEDRELLRLDERVEDVDHRDVRAHHVARDDALGGVDGRAADVDEVVAEGGALVARVAAAVEDAAEQVVGEGDLHRAAEEADARVGRDAAGAGEDLERDVLAVDLDDLGERRDAAGGDLGELVVGDAGGAEGDDAAGAGVDAVVDGVHAGKGAPLGRGKGCACVSGEYTAFPRARQTENEPRSAACRRGGDKRGAKRNGRPRGPPVPERLRGCAR